VGRQASYVIRSDAFMAFSSSAHTRTMKLSMPTIPRASDSAKPANEASKLPASTATTVSIDTVSKISADMHSTRMASQRSAACCRATVSHAPAPRSNENGTYAQAEPAAVVDVDTEVVVAHESLRQVESTDGGQAAKRFAELRVHRGASDRIQALHFARHITEVAVGQRRQGDEVTYAYRSGGSMAGHTWPVTYVASLK